MNYTEQVHLLAHKLIRMAITGLEYLDSCLHCTFKLYKCHIIMVTATLHESFSYNELKTKTHSSHNQNVTRRGESSTFIELEITSLRTEPVIHQVKENNAEHPYTHTETTAPIEKVLHIHVYSYFLSLCAGVFVCMYKRTTVFSITWWWTYFVPELVHPAIQHQSYQAGLLQENNIPSGLYRRGIVGQALFFFSNS